MFLFSALFRATLHTLAKWGGQSSGNSKCWLNLLYWRCVLAPLPADDARPRRRSAEEQKEPPAAADSFPPFPTHEHVFGLEEDLSEDDEPLYSKIAELKK